MSTRSTAQRPQVPLSPLGPAETQSRLAYVNQHRELTLGLLLVAALLGHVFWVRAIPAPAVALLAAWWLASVAFVRLGRTIGDEARLSRFIFGYFLLELLLLTALAYYFGGVDWLATFFYAFTILYASIALKPPRGYALTVLAALFFAALVSAEYLNLLPPRALFAQAYRSGAYVAATLAFGAGAFLLMGYSSSQFARMLSSQARALEEANRELRATGQELRRHQDHLEELVRQRTEDLDAAGEELRRANVELRRSNEAKSQMLANVSHELRTPLTSIRSFSELLLNYPDENAETKAEFLGIIKSESERLTRLINDVLDLAKIESGRMQWRFVPVRLEEVIRTAAGTTRGWEKERQVAVRIALPSDLPAVEGDFDRLVQVATNLLANALKFSRRGGITIGAERRGGELVLFVRDSGPGIPPDELETIFEEFHQGSGGLKAKPQGTGLGLSICREIVQRHHGRIWVESAIDQGSTFYCSFPLARAASA